MNTLLSTAEVDSLLRERARARSAPAIEVPLASAAGLILREDIAADRDLPPFDRVMMDGYAVRCAKNGDNPEFNIAGTAPAGAAGIALPAGAATALEVATGAPLPAGAEAVIPYEDTRKTTESTFRLAKSVRIDPGQHIHRRASDYAATDILLRGGTALGPAEIGIAASCGVTRPRTARPPVIHVFGTGDELVPVEARPEPHQIRRSNAPAATAGLTLAGFPVALTGHLSDDAARERETLAGSAASADVIVVSGAVSRGRRDWIPHALDELGEALFHGVAQRPGKPMGVWSLSGGTTVFALPGNPVSTLVNLHRHVLPFLRRRAGTEPTALEPRQVKLAEPVAFAPPLTWFAPVVFFPDGSVRPLPPHNSGDYARLAETDGFIELAADRDSWKTGEAVPFHPWSR